MGFQETMHGFAALENVSVFIYSFTFVTEKVSRENMKRADKVLLTNPPLIVSISRPSFEQVIGYQ